MGSPQISDAANDAHDNGRLTVQICTLAHFEGLSLPAYETALAAGMDLLAAIDGQVVLGIGERAMIPTGLSIALPAGFEAQVRPRSGLAARNGITCLNTPGTVDADYRGEIKVILINHGDSPFVIERGMRIAQMVVARHERVVWAPVSRLDATARGGGGFGSTGTGRKGG